MKTHYRLTVIMSIAIVMLFYLVSKNNTGLIKSPDKVSILKNTFSDPVIREIDSLSLKKLMPFFKVKTDEFDPNKISSYKPKEAPDLPKGNAIYCYFEKKDDTVSNLRVRMQVENVEWLFFKRCQFLIDGVVYEYSPTVVEFNSGSPGWVCEWFDNSVNHANVAIVRALSKAKAAKVKIIGRHYDKVLKISNEQLKSINNTLSLYTAMGGEINS